MTTVYLDRSVDEVINWSKAQITEPTQNWQGLCQSHVRQAMGVGSWASSAAEAWSMIPESKKTRVGSPFSAPRGASLYYSGGKYGHVAIAIGKSTIDKCLSNDYIRNGFIDKAPRAFPRWGLTYVGWSFWTPFGELKPDKPKPMWDGQVPSEDGCFKAMNHGFANPAAYRIACRLFDLGMYAGTPQAEGTQRYPAKAVGNFQKQQRIDVNPLGAWSPEISQMIFY